MKPYKQPKVHIPIREQIDYPEPTLEEILSDPIVAAVMQADAVDVDDLGVMLGRIARALRTAASIKQASA